MRTRSALGIRLLRPRAPTQKHLNREERHAKAQSQASYERPAFGTTWPQCTVRRELRSRDAGGARRSNCSGLLRSRSCRTCGARNAVTATLDRSRMRLRLRPTSYDGQDGGKQPASSSVFFGEPDAGGTPASTFPEGFGADIPIRCVISAAA
jgi:hypothetical protein